MKSSKHPIKIPQELKIKISPECLDLLMKLLDVNKRTRISWDEYFDHPWLRTNHIMDYENNLLMNPLKPIIPLPEIFQIEDNISKFVLENRARKEEHVIEDDTDDELYLSASSVFEEGIQVLGDFSESGQSSSNALSSNSMKISSLYPSMPSSSTESPNESNVSINKMENSYVLINNMKYTDKLESSAYESRMTTVEGDVHNVINVYTKKTQTQPIDIKKKKKFDFHDENNLVDIEVPNNSSLGSLQNNRTQDVRFFFSKVLLSC